MESALVYLDAEVEQWWAAGILESTAGSIPPKFTGDTRVAITGWRIGVDTSGSTWRRYHILYK